MFTACSIIHPRCCRPVASSVHCTTSCNTQSGAPEDARTYRPKHVELTGIINKPLLLHLVGCLYYCISDAWSCKHQDSSICFESGQYENFCACYCVSVLVFELCVTVFNIYTHTTQHTHTTHTHTHNTHNTHTHTHTHTHYRNDRMHLT